MGSTHRVSYNPFAEYSHMAQKTPCRMAYNTLGQEKQRERITSFKKLVCFLFKVHCIVYLPARCFWYHKNVFCKGSIVHTCLGKMIDFSYLLHITNILKGCMIRSHTTDSSGCVKYFFLSQVIRHEFERRIQHIVRSHQAFFTCLINWEIYRFDIDTRG